MDADNKYVCGRKKTKPFVADHMEKLKNDINAGSVTTLEAAKAIMQQDPAVE